MTNPKIEYSTDRARGGITRETIQAGLAETRRLKAQPGFEAREKRRLAEIESRLKKTGTKFPSLAGKTKPAVKGMSAAEARTRHCQNVLKRLEATAKTFIL